MTEDTRTSRIASRALRVVLMAGVYLGIVVGISLVTTPFAQALTPQDALLVQKVIAVMGGVPVVVCSGIAIWLLASWLRRRVLMLRQAENDRAALQIMTDLRGSAAARVPEFYLYLRAFETTGRLHVPWFLRMRKFSIGLNRLVTNDAESYVSSAIRRVAPLVALGRAGEAIGAGRIVTDDERWQADIRVLMDRARAILVVPSDRPGTLWEIATLQQNNLLHKVIFIMPPRSTGALDTRERWDVARQAMAAHGLEAPEYLPRGLLFVVGSDGKVSNLEPMLLPSPRQVRKSLKRLLSTNRPKSGFFNAVASADRRSRRAAMLGWVETLRQLSPYALLVVGPFLPHPDVGFNPAESWSTVIDRTMTRTAMAEDTRASALAASDRYRSLEAQVPLERRDEWRSELLIRGLPRLNSEQLRGYDVAFGEMLARVDTRTCEAIVRGDIQPDAMVNALTYIPSQHVRAFLDGGTAAILAAAEDRPLPTRDPAAVEAAAQQFFNQLGPEGQQRYQRINQSASAPSDEDRCWLTRAAYSSVATMPAPHASVWAVDLAMAALPGAEQAPSKMASRPSVESAPDSTASVHPRDRVADAVAPATPRVVDPAPPPSYSRLLDDAGAAMSGSRFNEAVDLTEQLIRLDASRHEGWSLRGVLALNVYGDLAVARESYENAISRGGRAVFRVVHDHGSGQQPCGGSLFVTPTAIEFMPIAGDHRFQWPYATIREAAVNDIYGSQFGMFHIKAQMDGNTKNFNFAMLRTSDQQLMNRRADAEMLLELVSRQRALR
jgi:hypothetical protein